MRWTSIWRRTSRPWLRPESGWRARLGSPADAGGRSSRGRAPTHFRTSQPPSCWGSRPPTGWSRWPAADLAGVETLQLSRHGPGHIRLSNQVSHRANIWALKQAGATAVIACTACGAVDSSLAPGSLDHLRRSALRLQPPARRLAVHVLLRARRSRPRALDPPRRSLFRWPAAGFDRGRGGGGSARPLQGHVRTRGRSAVQHAHRDRSTGGLRGDGREPDCGTGDRPVR